VLRTSYYGADEFFEIQAKRLLWSPGHREMLDLARSCSTADATRTSRPRVQRSRLELPHRLQAVVGHFIDALLNGTTASLTPEEAVKVLQLCFAVYLAGERTKRRSRLMTGSVTPTGWADW